jgi:hypothetical protein
VSTGNRALLVALVALLAAPAAASASAGQETILMDDAEIVYAKPDHLDRRLAEIKALGVDRVRVSVYWRLLAPSPEQKQKPASQYPSSSPKFYGARWDRYDRIVALAAKNKLGVLFTLTGPAPLWATGTPEGGRSELEHTWTPSPAEFKDFVTAVGTRYTGTYQDEEVHPGVLPIFPGTIDRGPLVGRVDHWSIWNEPNHPGWLTPQAQAGPGGKGLVAASPRVYRPLVDAAWSALQATGHKDDTTLLGETAPGGLLRPGLTHGIKPLRFIRELYCLADDGHPYTGAQAQARGCPASFDAAGFVSAHPGLFAAAGWAHHPYSLLTSPRAADVSRDNATLSGMPRLTSTLDRTFATYGQSARLPIWVTEYGYQTNPPDPWAGMPPARQADWLDTATLVAFRNPRIVSMAQFLLVDDGPNRKFPQSDPRYWGTFQTGLLTAQGKPKPSYESFKRPIDVTPRRARSGATLHVLGQLRTAGGAGPIVAQIQFRALGSRKWKPVATVTVANARAFLDASVRARRSGAYRIVWPGAGATRAVGVRVGGR